MDFKEIKPVNPKGDQPWIFIGRTDAKAEAPIRWPLHASIAANPVEFREAPPNSTVTLTSQRHAEKLPEVTGTSQWNPGFPAATHDSKDPLFLTFSSLHLCLSLTYIY